MWPPDLFFLSPMKVIPIYNTFNGLVVVVSPTLVRVTKDKTSPADFRASLVS